MDMLNPKAIPFMLIKPYAWLYSASPLFTIPSYYTPLPLPYHPQLFPFPTATPSLEVKKGPKSFTRSSSGVERKPFGRRDTMRNKPRCVLKWRPKGSAVVSMESEAQLEGKTTVMVKNIPNKFSKEVLLGHLDKHCCEENEKMITTNSSSTSSPSEYDFVYLPMDFRTGFNRGYAFVNFTSAVAAVRFYRSYNKHTWKCCSSAKICQITPARIQGKETLIRHFQHSVFPCNTDDFLPTAFKPPCNGAARTRPNGYVVGTCRRRL